MKHHKKFCEAISDVCVFGLKLSSDGTISTVQNVCWVHYYCYYYYYCRQVFAHHGVNTSLIFHLQHVHPILKISLF